jgi:RimJ/RimL family protein N-acetyltransferase
MTRNRAGAIHGPISMTSPNSEVATETRSLSLRRVLQAVRNRLWYRREMCLYSCHAKNIVDLPKPQVFRRNCYEDLRHYAQCDPWQMTIEQYRVESYKRLKLGYHLYTIVQDGKLAFYGWLAERQQRHEDPLLGQVWFPPADASVIFDCYTHPAMRGQGLYHEALCQMLHDALTQGRAEQVCIGSLADNLASRHVIEKIGFRYIGSMIKEGRLFTLRRYAVAVDSQFHTALL